MITKQDLEKQEVKCSDVYEKPVFIKEKKLTFPKEIIEEFNGGRFCLQCSACHGCQ